MTTLATSRQPATVAGRSRASSAVRAPIFACVLALVLTYSSAERILTIPWRGAPPLACATRIGPTRPAPPRAPGSAAAAISSVSRGGASPSPTHGIRGGGSSSSSGVAGGSSDLVRNLGTIWTSVVSLARTHVEPALRDPNGRIFAPLVSYLEDRAAEARERRAEADAGGVSMAGFGLVSGRVARVALLALLSSEALSRAGFFADEDGRRAKERARRFMNEYDVEGRVRRARDRAEGWWAEARSPGGIFHGKTWEDRFIVRMAVREDVIRPLRMRYDRVPDKTKFAVGAAVGMTASPVLASLTKTAVRWAAIAYIVAEVTSALGRGRRRRRRSVRVDDLVDTSRIRRLAREYELDDEVDDAIRSADRGLRRLGRAARGGFDVVFDVLDDALEGVRGGVRRAARDPESFLDGFVILADDNREAASGFALGTLLGFLL